MWFSKPSGSPPPSAAATACYEVASIFGLGVRDYKSKGGRRHVQAVSVADSLRAYLDSLARCRDYLVCSWLGASSAEGADSIRKSVQDVLSVILLVRYLRQQRWTDIDQPERIFASLPRPSASALAKCIQRRLSCPILRTVLEPDDFDGSIMPAGLAASAWLTFLEASTARHFDGLQLPLSVFGAFHEMCLKDCAVGESRVPRFHRRRTSTRHQLGAHYSPLAIVQYLAGRTLAPYASAFRQNKAAPIRVLDPACGAGAFLVEAFRYAVIQRFPAAKIKAPTGRPPLQDCLRVLRSSIFGCDIDPQAVQWTRRSLLLTTRELCGTTLAGGAEDLKRLRELKENIVCADFLSARLPDVAVNAGPPHAVIGGPPFVRYQELIRHQAQCLPQFKQLFQSASCGQFDLYMLFIERALEVLAPGGRLGFSVSSSFLRSLSGQGIREVIGRQARVTEVLECEARDTYAGAATQIALFSATKSGTDGVTRHVRIRGRCQLDEVLPRLLEASTLSLAGVEVAELPPKACSGAHWTIRSAKGDEWLRQLQRAGPAIGSLGWDIRQGISTGADDVFLVRRVWDDGDGMATVRLRGTNQVVAVESETLQPVLRARDIRGYGILSPPTWCICPYSADGRLPTEDEIASGWPHLYAYLKANEERLRRRIAHQRRSVVWLRTRPGPHSA